MTAEPAKELEEYLTKHNAQAAEVAKARATGEAAKADAESAANELAVMAETVAGLEAALEAQRNVQRRSFTAEYLDLAAGDDWPASPPTRTLRLLGHVGDLYDPSTTDLLSNEYGTIAVEAAERWREFLPHGGNVHLSPVGQAVALVNGTWTYLGSLDDGSAEDLLDEVIEWKRKLGRSARSSSPNAATSFRRSNAATSGPKRSSGACCSLTWLPPPTGSFSGGSSPK
jgi:hypothetical protein